MKIIAAIACAALAFAAGTAHASTRVLADDSIDTPPSAAVDEPAPIEAEPATGGVDVGLGASASMDPDPALYATEVLCPDGSIWAVAIDDEFACPT